MKASQVRPTSVPGFVFAFLLSLVLSFPSFAADAGRSLVLFDAGTSEAEMRLAVAEAGGEIDRLMPEIGVAVVIPGDGFTQKVRRSPAVLMAGDEPAITAQPLEAVTATALAAERPSLTQSLQSLSGRSGAELRPWAERDTAPPVTTYEDLVSAPFYSFGFQWDLDIMQTPDAWALGSVGDPDVKVAIVSTGIDYTHPELAGKVDLNLSKNFVPEDAAMVEDLFPGAHPIADLGIHGTYVASLIACNAYGQACPAPNVTLVGVGVLNFEETGVLGDLLEGIYYAANIRSDVIVLPELYGRLHLTDPDEFLEIFALWRAVTYAKLRGAVVFAAPWTYRGELGYDADADGDELLMPAQAGATVVAATGTEDQWSGISTYGYSLIDVAAPGGQVDLDTVQPPPDVNVFSVGVCSSFTQEVRFGLPATCNKDNPPQYLFSFGVRASVGLAAGVAALIDSESGGRDRGHKVRAQLLRTADDVLDPGRDAYTGHGRVNAFRAVTE